VDTGPGASGIEDQRRQWKSKGVEGKRVRMIQEVRMVTELAAEQPAAAGVWISDPDLAGRQQGTGGSAQPNLECDHAPPRGAR
jgi:hypothetical protein